MATSLAFVLLVATAAHLAPRLAGRDICYGVTVDPTFLDRPEGRAISRRYTGAIWFMAAIAAAMVVTDPAPLASGPLLLGQTLGASLAFVRARRATLRYAVRPAAMREAELGPRPRLPGGVLVQAGPFVLLMAAAAYVAINWVDVPARFPTHWNLAGRPDGWMPKSLTNAFRGLGLGLVICSLMLYQSKAVLTQARLRRISRAEATIRRTHLLGTLAAEYTIALLVAWAHVLAMFAESAAGRHLPLAFTVAPFALAVLGSALVVGLRRASVPSGPPVGDTTPDARWLLGLFYVNPRDPALVVEKRFRPGYSFNLGNPRSWLVIGVTAVAVATLLLLP